MSQNEVKVFLFVACFFSSSAWIELRENRTVYLHAKLNKFVGFSFSRQRSDDLFCHSSRKRRQEREPLYMFFWTNSYVLYLLITLMYKCVSNAGSSFAFFSDRSALSLSWYISSVLYFTAEVFTAQKFAVLKNIMISLGFLFLFCLCKDLMRIESLCISPQSLLAIFASESHNLNWNSSCGTLNFKCLAVVLNER